MAAFLNRLRARRTVQGHPPAEPSQSDPLQHLTEELASRDYYIQERAAQGLAELADTRAIPALVGAVLSDTSCDRVRWASVDALRQIGSGVAPLVDALRSGPEDVRRRAADALGRLADAQAAEPLVAALHDDQKRVRRSAAEALRALGHTTDLSDAATEALADFDQRGRGESRERQQRMIARSYEELESAEPSVRASAVGRLGQHGVIEPALAALGDPAPEVRRAAAQALAHCRRDTRAVEPLIALLNDEDAGVRHLAAETLINQQARDPRAIAALLVRIGDDESIFWVNELRQLIQKQRPIDALVAALGSEQLRVRRFAARALANIDDPRAVESLTGALDDEDPGVRWFARAALRKGTRLTYPRERQETLQYLSASQFERMTAEFGELLHTIYPTGEFTYGSFGDFVDYDRMVLSTLFHELKEAGAIESTGYETFRVTPGRTGGCGGVNAG